MIPLPVLAEKEKEPGCRGIARPDGAADRVARIVEIERRRRGLIEEGSGVEPVVAKKLVRAAVKFTRAALGDDVDERAGAAAEFGGIPGGQHFDLFDGIEARAGDGVGVAAVVHVVGAIDHEIRRARPHAVDGLPRRRETEAERISRRDGRPGKQLQKLRVIPAVQRDVVHLFAGNDPADVARERLDAACQCGHRNGFRDRADLELNVDRDARRGIEHDIHPLDRFEPRELDPNRVGASRQAREGVVATAVGDGGLGQAGAFA